MRYYSIVITDPNSGELYRPPSLAGLNLPASWTSFVNNQSIPGALNVEIDAYVSAFATPTADTFIRIWGISIAEISQANDLRGKNIQVFAGMQKGLPLANPAQAGLIFEGFILKSYGNWIGLDQTLDLNVAAGSSPDGVGSQSAPKNIVHNWKKGTQLSAAITSTLTTAFPGYTADVNISPNLVLTEDDVGYYQTPTQYAQYVRDLSKSIVGGTTYAGVSVTLKQKKFSVYDGTTAKDPLQISFQDLIGQPTWIGPQEIQVKTVMRADISVGDYVKMPPTVTTTTSGGAIPDGSSQRANAIFQGSFIVNQVRHIGNLRQPDAASWNTTFDVSSVQAS